MIKDKYKLAMENIKPSPEKIMQLKQMHKDSKLPKTRTRKRKIYYRFSALAACVVLLISVFNTAPSIFSRNDPVSSFAKEASSYTELYRLLRNINSGKKNNSGSYYTGNAIIPDEKAAGFVQEQQKTDSETVTEYLRTNPKEYSRTNLQVLGVDEADIVKTDGKYIYAVANKYIYIISAQDGALEIVSKISRYVFDGETLTSKAFELYIRNGKLIVMKEFLVEDPPLVGKETVTSGAAMPAYDPAKPIPDDFKTHIEYMYKYNYYDLKGQTAVGAEIYDISDVNNPKSLNTLGLSGSVITSRMVGDILYLVTNYYVGGEINKSKPESYVPMTYKNEGQELVSASDIIYNPDTSSFSYVIVSAIDTSENGEMVSVKTMLGYGRTVYSTEKNLYLTSHDYVEESGDGYTSGYNRTRIFRLSLNKGKIDFAAEGTVPGSVLNQFAMDEYDGIFRIVTTVNKYKYSNVRNGADEYQVDTAVSKMTSADSDKSADTNAPEPGDAASPPSPDGSSSNINNDNGTSNALYTLNADLEIIGKIENLAPSESVYSARFMGDTAYFVTFRQVDPLFAVDLSDPAKPYVLGELKIPGFSEYLHSYGEGLLFGLGKNADTQTGAVNCMKLTMFDISNPENVTEKHTLLLNDFHYSPASYNHKAILINPVKNIIAFQADSYYLVYSYSAEKGFEKLAQIPLFDTETGYMWDMSDSRGLYIDEFMYLVSNWFISSYNINNFTMEHKIVFEKR